MNTTRVYCAPTSSRIRAWLGSELVVDARDAVLLRRSASDLVYGFPAQTRLVGEVVPASAGPDSTVEAYYDLVSGDRYGGVQTSRRRAGV